MPQIAKKPEIFAWFFLIFYDIIEMSKFKATILLLNHCEQWIQSTFKGILISVAALIFTRPSSQAFFQFFSTFFRRTTSNITIRHSFHLTIHGSISKNGIERLTQELCINIQCCPNLTGKKNVSFVFLIKYQIFLMAENSCHALSPKLVKARSEKLKARKIRKLENRNLVNVSKLM